MTVVTADITYLQSTDAEFRAWGLAIHDSLVTAGLTFVTQTGQIDFTTVLKPSAANQQRGFQMWKFNDGLTEVYVKTTYGSGNDGATQPEFGCQIGFAIDGSGGFVGYSLSQRAGLRFTGGVAFPTRFCWYGATLVINISDLQWFVVERDRDPATGQPQSDGATLVAGNASLSLPYSISGFLTRGASEFVPSSGPPQIIAASNVRYNSMIPNAGGTYSMGNQLCVLPVYPFYYGIRSAQVGLMLASSTDVTPGSGFTAKMYDVDRTYRAINHYGDGGNLTRVCLLDEPSA